MTSWVIVRRADQVAVLETFSEQVAQAVNLKKYQVLPIMEYLQNFNKGLK
jgi:hypothetical protein